jgi:hypothetical protein
VLRAQFEDVLKNFITGHAALFPLQQRTWNNWIKRASKMGLQDVKDFVGQAIL